MGSVRKAIEEGRLLSGEHVEPRQAWHERARDMAGELGEFVTFAAAFTAGAFAEMVHGHMQVRQAARADAVTPDSQPQNVVSRD